MSNVSGEVGIKKLQHVWDRYSTKVLLLALVISHLSLGIGCGRKSTAKDEADSKLSAMPLTGGPDALEGYWFGTLQVGENRLRLGADLQKRATGWHGSLDSMDQGTRGIAMEVQAHGKEVDFTLPVLNAKFIAKLSADGKSLEGDWQQMGRFFPLTLQKTDRAEVEKQLTKSGTRVEAGDTSTRQELMKQLAGTWNSTLNVKGTKLRLKLTISNGLEGAVTAKLQSLDQGNVEIPVTAVSMASDVITIRCEGIFASFNGSLEQNGLKLVGDWTQGGMELPLNWDKEP